MLLQKHFIVEHKGIEKQRKKTTVTVCEIERKKRANNSVGAAAYKYEFVFQKF
jgi:hypothetical protein